MKYRYYVSVDDTPTDPQALTRTTRVAAGEAEAAVTQGMFTLFNNPAAPIKLLVGDAADAATIRAMEEKANELATTLPSSVPSALRHLLQSMGLKVVIDGQTISATFNRAELADRLGITSVAANGEERCTLVVPQLLNRCGIEMRLAIAPSGPDAPDYRDGNLVTLIVKAHQARDQLLGVGASAISIASMGHQHLTRMARLAYVAPELTKAILEGRQPKSLTARTLLRVTDLPLAWPDQRKLLGF